MNELQTVVLVVDDEPLNIEILFEYLEDFDFVLESAADGQEAWDKLVAAPDRYDIVVLDRMMPRMGGMEVLRQIKAHPVLQSVPVIMQTAMAGHEDILEGLQAGAYYYLTKPFDEDMLHSVVSTAVTDRQRYRQMRAESNSASRTFGMLVEGCFRFRDLVAARDLANLLANACPDPNRVIIGLSELLLNAVEHGNLNISYEEKTELQSNGDWHGEVDARLADPRYADREVEVSYARKADRIVVNIRDEGDGFEWQKYMDIDPERVFDTHGRGIAMSRMISFDNVEYRGKGNEVEVTVLLPSDD